MRLALALADLAAATGAVAATVNCHSEVLRWNLINAWPCRWRGAHLHTLGQEIAIESIALAYEALELESGSGTASAAA